MTRLAARIGYFSASAVSVIALAVSLVLIHQGGRMTPTVIPIFLILIIAAETICRTHDTAFGNGDGND